MNINEYLISTNPGMKSGPIYTYINTFLRTNRNLKKRWNWQCTNGFVMSSPLPYYGKNPEIKIGPKLARTADFAHLCCYSSWPWKRESTANRVASTPCQTSAKCSSSSLIVWGTSCGEEAIANIPKNTKNVYIYICIYIKNVPNMYTHITKLYKQRIRHEQTTIDNDIQIHKCVCISTYI